MPALSKGILPNILCVGRKLPLVMAKNLLAMEDRQYERSVDKDEFEAHNDGEEHKGWVMTSEELEVDIGQWILPH